MRYKSFFRKKLLFERKINDPEINSGQTKNFVGFLENKCLKSTEKAKF